ncbi:accessory gene regulator B family protein [Lutispora sp.]|uniref:accessory gene regulator B family protein n=1 Tax=Lutispora sp. TaxID=2828727 RepID=UPI003FA5A5F4
MVDSTKKRLIHLFVYHVYKKKLLSHSDIRKMRYGMEVIINELFKLGILIVLFKILEKLDLLIFFIIILIPIRCFSGCIHFHSNFNCLLFASAFF